MKLCAKRKVAFCVIWVKLATQINSKWRNEGFYRPVFENFTGIERYGPKRRADNLRFSAKMAAQNLSQTHAGHAREIWYILMSQRCLLVGYTKTRRRRRKTEFTKKTSDVLHVNTQQLNNWRAYERTTGFKLLPWLHFRLPKDCQWKGSFSKKHPSSVVCQ